MAYRIRFVDDATEHLDTLTARERVMVIRAITQQLTHEPTVATRNRSRMRENDLAEYRLRVSHLRVYYAVEEAARVVWIKAIGIKVRERVFVGGMEIDL